MGKYTGKVGAMDTEKKKIEFVYQAYADYAEEWPVFYLKDKAVPGSVCIDLTKEEIDEYKDTIEKYHKWQIIIKERGFPNMEDY